MADVITMLALSPTMEEGTIADFFKKEGDTVEDGEIIAEVETDKAAMEMESIFEGVLLKVLVKAGDTIKVGAPIAIVGEQGEDISDLLGDASGGASKAPAKKDTAPEEDPSTEKAASEAQKASNKEKRPAKADPPAPEETQGTKGYNKTQASAAPADSDRIKSSPLARRIAKDKGIDIATLQGSGPGGRIVKEDVEAALGRDAAAPQAKEPVPAAAAPAPSSSAGMPPVIGTLPEAGGERAPMSQMRKTIAKRLTQVWQATPHFYLTMEIDMAAAMAARGDFNRQLQDAQIEAKISVNDMIVKACALALRTFPKVNVAYAGDTLAMFDEVHVGVAVAIDDGLITPTIKNADQKTLTRISNETRELATKARNKKLKPHEYGGSTFSISNLGMYGIDHFQAVINPPEAAILACGAVKQVPVVHDGQLVVGTRMNVTMSCDHRAIDGALGAEFLQHVKKMLENPTLLLI